MSSDEHLGLLAARMQAAASLLPVAPELAAVQLAVVQPQLAAGLRAARAWRAHEATGRVQPRAEWEALAEALDALAAVVPGEGGSEAERGPTPTERTCSRIFHETGRQCDKPDNGHSRHSYELRERGELMEYAEWETPK